MRLENTHRRYKWNLVLLAGAGAVCVFVIVLGSLFLLSRQAKEVEHTGSVLIDSATQRVESSIAIENLTLEFSSDDLTFEEYLWQACPVVEWAERLNGEDPQISNECFSAFGEYVKREEKVLGLSSISQLLILDNAMTYERVFRDPRGDRARVLEALSRPECQFADGELIRWELKETCNADAFANYVNFLKVCQYQGYLSRWIALTKDDQALFETDSDRDPWENLGQEDRIILIKKHIEHAWAHEECKSSGLPNLEFEPFAADRELYQMLELVGRRVGERDPDLPKSNIAEPSNKAELAKLFLIAIAARLGDEWARHEYFGSDRWRLDSWDRYVQSEHPWRSQTKIFERFHNSMPSVGQVIDAVELVLALEDDKVEFDWQYLVNELCEYHVEEAGTSTNCQTAIELLDQSWDPVTYQRHLSVLSKFRAIALELDVYNNPSTKRVRLETLY